MEVSFLDFKPNPKQKLFLESESRYTAFGGARGGGKSWVVRAKAILLAMNYKGIRILFIRKTYPELYQNHITILESMTKGIATYNRQNKELTFVNGSKIIFGYLMNESDADQYQGQEYDILFVDEATQLTEKMFDKVDSSVRGANSFPKRTYLTCNPGGVGHAWVKRLFITKNYKKGENPKNYLFIQSLLEDNKVLMAMQPEYKAKLEALPYDLRQAWLYGSWDVFTGQVFKEFTNEPREDRKFTHVINPFEIPRYWTVYRSMDWGYSKPFSIGWYAFSETGCCYRIREWYGCSKDEANTGIQLSPVEVARQIKAVEAQDDVLKDFNIIGVADPAIFKSDNGEAISDVMARQGVYFIPGDNQRIAGKMQFHNRLVFDEDGYPMFYCFSNCREFIRTIPELIYDETKVEDVDTSMEDHIYDELRYVLMCNPYVAKPKPAKAIPSGDDPLNLREVLYF